MKILPIISNCAEIKEAVERSVFRAWEMNEQHRDRHYKERRKALILQILEAEPYGILPDVLNVTFK